jgi:hypothetical protein
MHGYSEERNGREEPKLLGCRRLEERNYRVNRQKCSAVGSGRAAAATGGGSASGGGGSIIHRVTHSLPTACPQPMHSLCTAYAQCSNEAWHRALNSQGRATLCLMYDRSIYGLWCGLVLCIDEGQKGRRAEGQKGRRAEGQKGRWADGLNVITLSLRACGTSHRMPLLCT